MASKTLVTIALAGVIGGGFLTAGGLLSKGYLARRANNDQYAKAEIIFGELADSDHNGEVSSEERGKVYCMIKGHYRKGSDPQLTFEETEKWLLGHGYAWNGQVKNYERIEPVKPEPCPQGTPKSYERGPSRDFRGPPKDFKGPPGDFKGHRRGPPGRR